MQNVLLVIDMQNDFIDGSLGTPEAVKVVTNVAKKIEEFSGRVIFTRDTHEENYMETQEGKNLPVIHCIRNTKGWEICEELKKYQTEEVFDKPTFGSMELGAFLKAEDQKEKIGKITVIGVCTDICVISNVLLIKAFLPEVEIEVDASCCAGVTPQTHLNALEAMKVCQVKVINE